LGSQIGCDPFVREHVVEVCRDSCAERSVGPDAFRACVEELRRRCVTAWRQGRKASGHCPSASAQPPQRQPLLL